MSIVGNEAGLKRTPLYDLHLELGAKMVPFAGYQMPVQYPMGILQEHVHTRSGAGLFDVSHMGQAFLAVDANAAEQVFPADLQSLKEGGQKYSFLLNDEGGILDDLMLTRILGGYYLVVNASNKTADFAFLRSRLAITEWPDRALLALQGPKAVMALSAIVPGVAEMGFMTGRDIKIGDVPILVTRSGYTGEDGFEISIPARDAIAFARKLLALPDVKPVGLGARDSLRLEAGLCLHGNDIDASVTPVEADLTWAVGKRRRHEGGFPGADTILRQLRDGTEKIRVGIAPQVRAPARAHTEILCATGEKIGEVTSGGFGPSYNGPLAMGYVVRRYAALGTEVLLSVRGKNLPANIVAMPFVPHRYFRKKITAATVKGAV